PVGTTGWTPRSKSGAGRAQALVAATSATSATAKTRRDGLLASAARRLPRRLTTGMLVAAVGLRLRGPRRAEVLDLVERVALRGDSIALDRFGQSGGAVAQTGHQLCHFPDALELFLQKGFRHGRHHLLRPLQPITCQTPLA